VPTRLYLDTARLGLMSRSAQQIHIDFVRFVGEEAGSLYFDQLLEKGTEDWPGSLRRRFPALKAWRGVSHLKSGLKALAGASPESHVLLAARSAQLMKLAAELLLCLCRKVMVTDLTWPSYRRILDQVQGAVDDRIIVLPLRKRILTDKLQPGELVDLAVAHYLRHGCQGLFLPAVDNLGIRLPVQRIVRAIEAHAEVRFVVVDGAQALNHIPLDLDDPYCDLLLAGAHKWLRAYHPMGIGYYGHPRSVGFINKTIRRLQRRGFLDDPLVPFLCDQPSVGAFNHLGETVGVAPLFSCQGAVDDANGAGLETALSQRLANADIVSSLLADRGWEPFRPAEKLRSGILLLRAVGKSIRSTNPQTLRRRLHDVAVSVTSYPKGIVRISVPPEKWLQEELAHLLCALVVTSNSWSLEPNDLKSKTRAKGNQSTARRPWSTPLSTNNYSAVSPSAD